MRLLCASWLYFVTEPVCLQTLIRFVAEPMGLCSAFRYPLLLQPRVVRQKLQGMEQEENAAILPVRAKMVIRKRATPAMIMAHLMVVEVVE